METTTTARINIFDHDKGDSALLPTISLYVFFLSKLFVNIHSLRQRQESFLSVSLRHRPLKPTVASTSNVSSNSRHRSSHRLEHLKRRRERILFAASIRRAPNDDDDDDDDDDGFVVEQSSHFLENPFQRRRQPTSLVTTSLRKPRIFPKTFLSFSPSLKFSDRHDDDDDGRRRPTSRQPRDR